MKRVAAVLVVLVLSMTVAFAALTAPQVTTPVNGDRIGPNIDVKGVTEGKQFVVVFTDVYITACNKLVGSVPGIRHWTNEDGTFAFRIATPRVTNTKDSELTYKVRVFTAQPGEKSDEVVITCKAQ